MVVVAWALSLASAAAVTQGAAAAPTQYWWRYPDADCGYDDVPGSCAGDTVDRCEAMCLKTEGCGGFNYPHGHLKKSNCLAKMAPQGGVDLYVLEATPQPPPAPPPWDRMWPVPKGYTVTRGGQIRVAPTFAITAPAGDTPRLRRAMERYAGIVNTSVALSPAATARQRPLSGASGSSTAAAAPPTLSSLQVHVATLNDELPTLSTDYSYELTVTSTPTPTATVTAPSVHGAVYGMETFAQLVAEGGLINASEVVVKDAPQYEHRAFMVDTGRRFWPVKTVLALLDAMGANKMNVLHLHISDNCRFAVQSAKYPRLTERLTGNLAGSYTPADVAAIVAYAADRGVRVIPEADLPGHSQGMQGLSGAGLVFCADNGTKAFADLRNDAGGQTVATTKGMYGDLASMFPGPELFIGADEVAPNGPCTLSDYEAIERNLTAFVTSPTGANRSVGGWEEYAFETGVAVPRSDRYFVNTWHYHTQAEATGRGFRTVASNDSHFYLVYGQPTAAYWVDIASGLNASQRSLLLGGSVAAWGDEWCYIAYCIHPGQYPAAHALFPPSADALFHESVLGVAFPRTVAAAGSFWGYNASVASNSSAFQRAVEMANARLVARGVPACPTECHCDAATRCGKPYAPEALQSTLSVEELLALHPNERRRAAAAEHFASMKPEH